MQPPNGLKASTVSIKTTASRRSCQRKIAVIYFQLEKKGPIIKRNVKRFRKKSWNSVNSPWKKCAPEFTWIYHLFVIEPRCDLVTPPKKTSGTTWKTSRIWPNLTPKRIAIYAIYIAFFNPKMGTQSPAFSPPTNANTARYRTFSFWSLGPNLKTFGLEKSAAGKQLLFSVFFFEKREISKSIKCVYTTHIYI